MVLSLVFSFLIIAPLSAWGFSQELVQSLKEKSAQQKLWEDPQWLKLGHYRKNFFGSYSSPLLGNFFISPQGSKDPQAEFMASLEKSFKEVTTARQYQCRFLARTSWLGKALHIPKEFIVECPEKILWKKQLGAEEVHIIFAASDLSSAGSSFGHTFLRLHNPKNLRELELLDYGVNYAAATGSDSGALYALKGIFGFYPGAYSMLPYYQKMREYTNLEGRNLWEYRLDLTPDQVSFLVDHLLELEGSYAPYYFADDNCSQQILELIEVARPDLNIASSFRDMTIPLDTVKALSSKQMLSGEKVRLSLESEWHQRYAELGGSQKNVLKKIIYAQDLENSNSLSPQQRAETLEAALSYLAIQEYREQKELKEIKYPLSVARAQLGSQTNPLTVPQPNSPLQSPPASAWYLGYGQLDQSEFYRLKYRRAFHDLLSDDSGLSPFSHLEVLSADFRYYSEKQNLDLYHGVFVKILSTSPVTELDTPLTWAVDMGTQPRLSPYVNIGAGLSFDFSFFSGARLSFLTVSENYDLADKALPHLGFQTLFMTKGFHWRALLGGAYLYNTSEGRSLGDFTFGASRDVPFGEFRFETRIRDNVPEWVFSVIF